MGPRSVADAIYSTFEGAEVTDLDIPGYDGVWIVPCEEEVNITVKLSGYDYIIHPMDATM
jgi:hypothetical protein